MIYNGRKYNRITSTSFIDKLDAQTFGDSEFSTLMDDVLGYSAPASASYTGKTWYWDLSAPAGGNGSIGAPFNTLAAANTASSTWDTIVLLGGGTTTNIPLLVDRLYDFSGCAVTTTGHFTVTGTGQLVIKNMVGFATPDTTFLTIGAGQGVLFHDSLVLSSGLQTIFSISGAGSNLEMKNARVEHTGNSRTMIIGAGDPYVSMAGSLISTDDEYAVTIASGRLTVGAGSGIQNDSGVIPTALVSGTGNMDVQAGGSIHNGDAASCVLLDGANSGCTIVAGGELSCSGTVLDKNNAGSSLNIAPLGIGITLGTITSGNIQPSAGSGFVYGLGDPSGAINGIAGQIYINVAPGGSTYINKGSTTWQAL